MKNIFLTLGLLALLPQPPHAGDFGLDGLGAPAFAEAGQGVPVPMAAPVAAEEKSSRASAPAQVQVKEWTVMVFLNAKNDLERFGMQDMNEMEKVGSTDGVNVVVEMGRVAGYDSSDGDWRGVRRYYVTRDLNPFRIRSRVVQDLGSVNMGDARELRDFIIWAKRNYPARRYALVVWNHGNGWLRGNPVAYERSSKGISFDDETGNNIDTPQLRMALGDAGGVDVFASDACLMQMAEVAYEVRGVAKYMVGSEETEPGAGYNYTKVLLPLALVPDMSAEAFGRVIVAAYWDNNKFGRVATHSMLDLSRSGELGRKMDAFARAAMASPQDKHRIREARNGAQSYAIDENKDLGHFLTLVERGVASAELKAAARDLNGFLEDGLVKLNMTSILPRSNSNGLAVYMPGVAFDSDYSALSLARDTQWDEFLRWQGR